MEYICIGREKQKYRFHLKDKDDRMSFRYDNAPHHKHIPDGINPSKCE